MIVQIVKKSAVSMYEGGTTYGNFFKYTNIIE